MMIAVFQSGRVRRNVIPTFALGLLLRLLQPSKVAAEDRVEYRYEDYQEGDGRIHIRTHSAGFDKALTSKISTKGLLVYDGISGATPTGEAPGTGSTRLPTVSVQDIRRAVSVDLSFRYGNHTTTPEYSYSEESDYISRGLALNHSIDFNQKNTTLNLGVAHNIDSVAGGPLRFFRSKDTTDVLVGLNQLLSPTTVFTANLTLGYAEGYLADPYRVASFVLGNSPDPIFSDPAQTIPQSENRPDTRFKQVARFSLTQGLKPLNASIEAEYRFYHDDWGILANTIGLAWYQKLTKMLTVSPSIRYYRQTAADFYGASFQGLSFPQYAGGTQVAFQNGVFYAFADDPAFPAANDPAFQIINAPARPQHFSADYRLAEMQAWTFGIGARLKIADHFTIDAAFKRYEMSGLDGFTSKSAFPSANVVTVGCGLWF